MNLKEIVADLRAYGERHGIEALESLYYDFEERAGIIEDSGEPRAESERRAWAMVVRGVAD